MSDAGNIPKVSIAKIFLAFLMIGATSLGGGVVGYLRSSLVGSLQWLDDETFVELLSICQSLPGLNASNMAILVGDRLRGAAGAVAALVGICLPGGLIMVAAAAAYGASHKDFPLVNAVLHGVSAAAVGMVLYVTVELARKTIAKPPDFFFAAATLAFVTLLHESVLLALFAVAPVATFWFRPRKDGQ
ncbi:chromate transporter [Methylocystis parvus]|uniref:Chromate transporter n=1 Tax=Methylocystis parvus TaxID=134 RepID=A0A6B8M6D4_9HYPH|nr:chromate transporter [Methylocystis parvus]QGM97642.1 chromate transporter [Methylocystis parvus]WBJ98424.1 chromate transporter [Methylocystis parvus OBBP]